MAHATGLLDRTKTMLAVVDVQERINAVMADQGHLSRIAVLVEACTRLGVPVVATEQYPKGLGSTVSELGRLLRTPPLVKDTFSCAREPAVRAELDATGRRQAIVAGIEAHVCVLQTALDLVAAGYQVHVPQRSERLTHVGNILIGDDPYRSHRKDPLFEQQFPPL